MERSEQKGPGVAALLWVGIKIKLGWVKAADPDKKSPAFWCRVEVPEFFQALAFFSMAGGVIWGLGKAFFWFGPWFGAAMMTMACSVADCEADAIRLGDARAFTADQRDELSRRGVWLPATLGESLEQGAASVAITGEDGAKAAASVKAARRAWEKERREKEDTLLNSAFVKAALSGKGVEEATRAAAEALGKRESEAREIAALLDKARAWAEASPRIKADWPAIRKAVGPSLHGARAKGMDPQIWALRQTHWGEAARWGALWLAGLSFAMFGLMKMALGFSARCRGWVEADRSRLTLEWERGQLGAAASQGEKKQGASSRL